MSAPLPPPSRQPRFALPPSLDGNADDSRAQTLARYLEQSLGRDLEVYVAEDYESLAKDVLAGRADLAWAPPYVCARVEAMGVRIAVRGIRRGTSSYRAVMLKRRGSPVDLEHLAGARLAWVDRDSVAGHLLPMSALKGQGLVPGALASQRFMGSYRAALAAVISDEADLTSVFCGAEDGSGASGWEASAELVLPGSSASPEPVGFTDESPNDGVAIAMATKPELVEEVARAFLALHEADTGRMLLQGVFHAERFEPAPRLGYRALYRVSLNAI